MNVELTQKVSGKLDWLKIIRKGKVIELPELNEIPNLILNSAFNSRATLIGLSSASTYTSTVESFEDLGNWSQTGTTLSRSSGTGIFPASSIHLGCELKFLTGQRCHVIARISDTQVTVSTNDIIPATSLRRYLTANSFDFFGNQVQSSNSSLAGPIVLDHVAGWTENQATYNFPSSSTAYILGSLIIDGARVKLPSTVSIDIDDQIQCSYTRRETAIGRNQSYDLSTEAVGLPQSHMISSIVGNGTNVDVTFTQPTHFLAGDKLDMRKVSPFRHAISSASSTSTTLTINSATAHGRSAGESVTIENASLAGYNGTFVLATASGTTMTITNANNPGPMGAVGAVRQATPAGYWNSLGLATIATMVSNSVARITSNMTNTSQPDLRPIAGDPGVIVRYRRSNVTNPWEFYEGVYSYAFTETNVKSLVDDTLNSSVDYPISNNGIDIETSVVQNLNFSNNFTKIVKAVINSGVNKNYLRLKQFSLNSGYGYGCWCQITLNTPFDKTNQQKLTVTISKQIQRDLP